MMRACCAIWCSVVTSVTQFLTSTVLRAGRVMNYRAAATGACDRFATRSKRGVTRTL